MLKYEIRKLFFNKATFAGVAFLLLFNIVHIFKDHYPTESSDPVYLTYLKVYPDIRGKDIETCRDIVEEKRKQLSDLPQNRTALYAAVYEEMLMELESLLQFPNENQEKREESLKKADQYRLDNRYLYHLNNELAKRYGERKLTEYRNVNRFPELVNYKFSYLLIIFLIIACGVNIFSGECASGACQVIKSTKRGHGILAGTKMIAMQIYVVLLAFLFAVCNGVCFQICYRFDSFSQPVYAIEQYRDLPVNDTIMWFLIKNFLVGLLGLCVIAMIVMLLSVLIQNPKMVFGCSLVCVVGLAFYRAFGYLGTGKIINLLNPVHYLLGEKMILYLETVDLGGYAVSNALTSTGIAFAEMIFLSAAIVYFYES